MFLLISLGLLVGVLWSPFPRTAPHTAVADSEQVAGRLVRAMLPEGQDRRAAARQLVTEHADSPWVIWVLMADDPFMWGEAAGPETKSLDRSVIAAMLESMPADAPDAVQLAMTKYLADVSRGIYPSESTRLGGMATSRGSARTAPIRDLARAALVRCLGEDHGFDINAWRAAIQQTDLKLPK